MTVREIQGHLAELYGAEVSPDLISRVTDAVLDEVRQWQNRPLDPVPRRSVTSECGTNRTSSNVRYSVAIGGRPDMGRRSRFGSFRP